MELNIKGASKDEILKKLFLSTLYLSAFTFGGGYVIVTLMKTKFVDQYHWIDEEEMLDLVAIAQSCPGAIAVNGAIVVGYKLAGLTGVLCSVIATVIPPFVILTAISFCYAAFRSNLFVGWMLKGMQSGVGAVIMEVSWGMASGIVREKQYLSIIIMVAAFIANYFYKWYSPQVPHEGFYCISQITKHNFYSPSHSTCTDSTITDTLKSVLYQ